MAHLFEPLKLRDITLSNRIGIRPCANTRLATVWRRTGISCITAAALSWCCADDCRGNGSNAGGRISPGDLGIWDDKQIEPLARIARFSQEQGCVPAIQLAHAGRKASVGLGWQTQSTLSEAEGGWTVVAPSPVSSAKAVLCRSELDEAGIRYVIAQFGGRSSPRARSGFQTVEIHAAHGYLLHQFLSPLSNRRTDASRQLREPYSPGAGSGRCGSHRMAGATPVADPPICHRLG